MIACNPVDSEPSVPRYGHAARMQSTDRPTNLEIELSATIDRASLCDQLGNEVNNLHACSIDFESHSIP